MSRVPLAGWVLAEIAPIAATPGDTLARETLTHVERGAVVNVRATIDEVQRRLQGDQGGSHFVSVLVIKFRTLDALEQGWTPQDGDRLQKQTAASGDVVSTTRYYLTNPREIGGGIWANRYWIADLSTDAPTRRAV